jgi:hypothetical protein
MRSRRLARVCRKVGATSRRPTIRSPPSTTSNGLMMLELSDLLLSRLLLRPAVTRLVVMEASRRNPYERRSRTYSHGLAPIQTSENAPILNSAAPCQVVEDPTELHSQLMTALLYADGFFEGDRGGLQQHSKHSGGCYLGPTDSSCVIYASRERQSLPGTERHSRVLRRLCS